MTNSVSVSVLFSRPKVKGLGITDKQIREKYHKPHAQGGYSAVDPGGRTKAVCVRRDIDTKVEVPVRLCDCAHKKWFSPGCNWIGGCHCFEFRISLIPKHSGCRIVWLLSRYTSLKSTLRRRSNAYGWESKTVMCTRSDRDKMEWTWWIAKKLRLVTRDMVSRRKEESNTFFMDVANLFHTTPQIFCVNGKNMQTTSSAEAYNC